jgi:hypothetical protein
MLDDGVFNMLDNTTGLNVDFMSYAVYAEAGFNPEALLDPEIMTKASQIVFSTFFQHFVNANISREHGGWVYQPIGEDLQVNPPMVNMPDQKAPDGSAAPRFEDVVRNTTRTTTATTTTRVEVLRINPVAFWISTSILVWIVIVIIILASVQRKYYGGMMRNVECIADTVVLIAGSERLLTVINEKGIDTIMEEDNILSRLGWFRDPDGTMRWRIELVDSEQEKAQPIRLGPAYTPIPVSNEDDDADDISDSRDSSDEQSMAHAQPLRTTYMPVPGVDDADTEHAVFPVAVPSLCGSTPSIEVSPIARSVEATLLTVGSNEAYE